MLPLSAKLRTTPEVVISRPTETEEEEYAYVQHKAVPLVEEDEKSGRMSLIPDSCFHYKDVLIVEDDDNDPYPIGADKERRCYLSSKGIVLVFEKQFYDLARTIGKNSLVGSAKRLDHKILCRGEVSHGRHTLGIHLYRSRTL